MRPVQRDTYICSPHGWAVHYDSKDNVINDVGDIPKGKDMGTEGH